MRTNPLAAVPMSEPLLPGQPFEDCFTSIASLDVCRFEGGDQVEFATMRGLVGVKIWFVAPIRCRQKGFCDFLSVGDQGDTFFYVYSEKKHEATEFRMGRAGRTKYFHAACDNESVKIDSANVYRRVAIIVYSPFTDIASAEVHLVSDGRYRDINVLLAPTIERIGAYVVIRGKMESIKGFSHPAGLLRAQFTLSNGVPVVRTSNQWVVFGEHKIAEGEVGNGGHFLPFGGDETNATRLVTPTLTPVLYTDAPMEHGAPFDPTAFGRFL